MRNKKIMVFLLLLFILYLLTHPALTLRASSRGLLLWFHTLLPTLLPFLILTNIVNEIIPVSAKRYQCFVLFTGLLCGFPLGAKLCADGVKRGRLTVSDAQYLLPLSNMASPSFIVTYILLTTLGIDKKIGLYLLCIYLPVLLVGVVTKHFLCSGSMNTQEYFFDTGKKFSIAMFDQSILNSFEVITKLGGYMMLFSILGAILQELPWFSDLFCGIFSLLLEITTGSQLLSELSLSSQIQDILVLSGVNFGGISFLVQTAAMIRGSGLKLVPYIITKAIIASMTAFLVLILTI